MRLAELSRGFGFRVAAITAALVLGSMVLLGGVVYLLIDDFLEQLIAERIENEAERLVTPGATVDVASLTNEITQATRSNLARRYAYRLYEVGGRHLAGDAWIRQTTPGWDEQSAPVHLDNSLNAGNILLLTREVGPNLRLAVGRDIQWIADVEAQLLSLMSWVLLGGLALAISTAMLAMRFVSQRIDLVVGSAHEIMDGNLKQRVPVTGAGDDFDHLAEVLNEMLDRIQGLIVNIEQVTNDIAHDLRTPLGRLRQGLEQARTHAATTDEYATAVDRAIAEADGLLSTFTALLRIAQIEAGKSRSQFRELDLSEVMRSVVEAYEATVEESGHRLSAQIADAVGVIGDRDLLVQAFANLIENAITHTPAGSTLTISLSKDAGGATACFRDDGPGVPSEEHDKIFQRFYRREQSRTSPGTGLGLSLVSAVAKLHGASIDVGDNQPGLSITLAFPPAVR